MAPAKRHDETAGLKPFTTGLTQADGLPFGQSRPWEAGLPGVNQLALLEQALRLAANAERRLLAQAERISKLEVLTTTDEVTGLLNRRGFDAQLTRALASANRNGTTGVLAISDVDDFKKINDRYGHPIGDEILCKIARRILANVRETDYVARIGGDEFAILMSETEIAFGLRRLETLNNRLMRSIVTMSGHRIPVRVSFGIESFGPGDQKKDLIERADAAMFHNKRRKTKFSSKITII